MQRLSQTLFLMSLVLLLTACGFSLRRPQVLAPQIHALYIQTTTPDDPFIQELDHMLIANGVQLMKNPKQADAILNITSIQNTNTMINNGGINVSGFYTAYLTVTFNVVDAQGHILIPSTTLQQSQDFSSNATQVLSGNTVVAQLAENMQEALAQNIIDQLAAIPNK